MSKFGLLLVTTPIMQIMKPSQQRGKRVPIQLQQAVTEEIKRMVMMGKIMKVDTIKEDVFIHPTVITVKKDRSVKIAIDTRKMNEAMIADTKYLPNVEKSIDQIMEKLEGKKEKWFTKLELKEAYTQIPLEEKLAKQCNIQILGGEATGTYRFKKGFYGLTTIANEFQRNMEETLRGEQNATTIFGEILVYSNGTKDEHMKIVMRVCKRLNDAGVRLDGRNSVFAATRVEWAGYD